jgi:hypothetical protein
MVTNNFAIYGVKVFSDLVLDLVYFPVWWYTRGLKQTTLALFRFLQNRERGLGLFVWIKNIFKPMYAQEDFAGIAISFFMRLIQIIVRGFAMLFWLAIALSALLLWFVMPVIIVSEIVFQLIM